MITSTQLIASLVFALFVLIVVADVYPQVTAKKSYQLKPVKRKYKKVKVKKVEK